MDRRHGGNSKSLRYRAGRMSGFNGPVGATVSSISTLIISHRRGVVRAGGLPVDLLSDGYVVVHPSSTHLEPTGGGPYRWTKGYSPADIPLAELAHPPEALLRWWTEQAHKERPRVQGNAGKLKAWQLLDDIISEGRRNATLTQIGGCLRLYHPTHVVEALLMIVNDARCRPPLDDPEVRAVARSYALPPTRCGWAPQGVGSAICTGVVLRWLASSIRCMRVLTSFPQIWGSNYI